MDSIYACSHKYNIVSLPLTRRSIHPAAYPHVSDSERAEPSRRYPCITRDSQRSQRIVFDRLVQEPGRKNLILRDRFVLRRKGTIARRAFEHGQPSGLPSH